MRRWSRIVTVISVLALAYVAGVMPAPARVTVDHCYVTYDRLETQHSRCVGHWSRLLHLVASGPIDAVPVDQNWQAFTVDPNADYEWEVAVPATSRSYTALTVLTYAWLVPWFVQVLLTAISVTALGGLAWLISARLRSSVSPVKSRPNPPASS
jgi:hypothetical protein